MGRYPRRHLSVLALLVTAFLTSSCQTEPPPAPTATNPPPTATSTPTRIPPSPTPTATPIPNLAAGEAIVVGGELRTRAEPSSTAELKGTLKNLQTVGIAATVKGENWLVGSQTWVATTPAWASEWHRLEDGSFVYGAFIFVLREGEVSPLAPAPGQQKWIDVDISEQVARAMMDDTAVFTARISSGAAPFQTPIGGFAIERDGRIAVERMTATQAGYEATQAQYDVERVLFTQYFDRSGNALHLNYWRPTSVFGSRPTSHGCVGLEVHEAQYFWLFAAAGTRVEIHQ